MAYKERYVNFCSTNAHFGQKVNFVSNKQTVVGEVVIPAEAGIQSINISTPLFFLISHLTPHTSPLTPPRPYRILHTVYLIPPPYPPLSFFPFLALYGVIQSQHAT